MSQLADINKSFNEKLKDFAPSNGMIIELWYDMLSAIELDGEDIITIFEGYRDNCHNEIWRDEIYMSFNKHIDYEKRCIEDEYLGA